MRRVAGGTFALCVCLVALGFAVWGALALWYRLPAGPEIRAAAAIAWALLLLDAAATALWRSWSRALVVVVVAAAGLIAWWSTVRPLNDRNWQPDLARTVRGTVDGDILTLTDVRNFEWRTETDYTPRWETRRYDLNQLVSLDLTADYWAGEAIAHTLVSFGFADGSQLMWSIEQRREVGEVYSVLEGFFKQAELIILAGDERDLVRLRTNVRGEDLRLYRLNVSQPIIRRTLLQYVADANELADHPRWYNTATTNCTTMVFRIARAVEPGIPLDRRVLLSGYFPDYAYDQGVLDRSLPFSDLREKAKLSARARAADAEPSVAFSKAIRTGIPGIPGP